MAKVNRFSIETQAGPILTINEDCVGVDIVNNLFMVIDGFGGVSNGPACVTNLLDTITTFYTRISGDPDSTLPFFFSNKYLIEGNAIINALNYAHAIVCKDNFEKKMDVRGGASVIAAAMSENIMTFVSSGNCASYICRKGSLEEVTTPDILLNITRDTVSFENGTVPMSGLGLFEELHTHVVEKRILDGDVVILLSDGVYSKLKKSEILHMVDNNDVPFDKKAKSLLEFANSRGNLDNQAALFLQF